MKSSEIRERFLSFFEKNGHTRIDSSSLVPVNDPTLLFTNAGMNQFKEVFLGLDVRDYNRATTSQRCVRAGGKHNDLENVGYTARHHTFFEMLGNFSFGDYFKEDAIRYAWTFLTEELGLPKDRLWVTVHYEDKEAEDIWLNKMGIDPNRFSRMGDKDNFWMMGDTGPCGPCSEIFYDHGPEVAGGPPGSEGDDLDRYIEIWNLVFMQFDQQPDGSRVNLPKPSVDTGMGLERLSAVLQHVHSNYEIDLFQALIKAAAKVTGASNLEDKSLRVIADHIRSAAFLVVDGVMPSNEGRGYVLRRIIRRAIRHGHKVGQKGVFFYQLVDALVAEMGQPYPELARLAEQVKKVLRQEEEQFAKTLDNGMRLLTEVIEGLEGQVIPGETVFKLYDTYGFPLDLTADIAREHDLIIDEDGFNKSMERQRKLSQESSDFSMKIEQVIDFGSKTEFSGYEVLSDDAVVAALLDGEQNMVAALAENTEGAVVLDKTAFYAESGGQAGDVGVIEWPGGRFEVRDTIKNGDNHVHYGKVVKGELTKSSPVKALVDQTKRATTAKHHSATHLLHAALRQVLGEHVQQKGSLVTFDRLRFDFSHFEPVTVAQLTEIEQIVNQQVIANTPVQTELMPIDKAKEKGAMALFGEKYGDEVRVLTMGENNYSVELCGGTHVSRTGDIGLVKLVAETGIAAGVRRIEAVAGPYALAYVNTMEQSLHNIAGLLKASSSNVQDKVQGLLQKNRQMEKELDQLKSKLASSQGSDLVSKAEEVGGTKVLAVKVDGVDQKALAELMDQLKNKLGSCVVVLASVIDGKGQLAVGVSKDLTSRIKAGELVNYVAGQLDGKGGGKPDLARAGFADIQNIERVLAVVPSWVGENL
ncbi:alanine--tRNA ligase [Gynuella sunshinyii]|uniref:Alanine--tRNA ligase n=1 Tax=Gynuella sunshinyii YC6258 TaxID=1445510 RepID=A0A0C5VVT2_9GAMM|nr:alanine--tRNA ligase [Gynuella sunshinyii]AJQ94574.1 alanyl-tRNA synthetase [Gynuella sunshinyii YC6258]